MGIFTFLKKLLSEPEKPETTIIEKIKFSDIEEFIRNKTNDINKKEEEKISLIRQKIKIFTEELRGNIKAVDEVEIELKEKNDKIKSAVYEGRKKYIEFLERFIENIEDINETTLEKVTENINSAFLRFNENSGKSYERATILIGKEMGNIRETLKRFSNELISIFNSNKEIIIASKRLSLIKSKVNEIKETDEKLLEIDKEILSIENKINNKEKEIKETSERILKMRDSSEYLENIEKEKNLQVQEKEFENKIYELKQLIDFKALSNFFHILEDRMAIVKLHREDFAVEFKKDMGSRLLNLLNESKLNTEKIYDIIKHLQDKEKEIENIKKEIKKDEIQVLSLELEKEKEEIDNLAKEREGIEKKKEKLNTIKKENFSIIKQELSLINLILEE